MSIRDRFVNNKKLVEYGNMELAFVLSTLQQGILLWLFLRDLFAIPNTWAIFIFPAVVIFKVGVSWVLGWGWDKSKLITKEAKWGADRNPYMVEILSIVKELKKQKSL